MSNPDTSLFWSLERLSAERLSHDSLIIVLRELKQTHGEALLLPALLKGRIVLNSLSSAEAISGPVLRELKTLLEDISTSPDFQEEQDDSDETKAAKAALREVLTPPHELMLQVKTELVVQTWRDSVQCSSKHIKDRIESIFGDNAQEEAKKNELKTAATDPAKRLHVGRQMEGEVALHGVKRFAAAAIEALPPTLLTTINDDINRGLYVPGNMDSVMAGVKAEAAQHALQLHQAAALPAAAFPLSAAPPPVMVAPAQPRATPVRGAVSPYNAGPSAMAQRQEDEQSPAGTAAKRPRMEGQFDALRNARGALHAAGGADPLQEAAARAALAHTQLAEHLGAMPPGSAARLQHMTSPEAGLPAPLPGLPAVTHTAVPPLQRAAPPQAQNAPPATLKKDRRPKRKWTAAEERALLDGFYEFGRQWAEIHKKYHEIFVYRNQVDLKDKWRNMKKVNHRECLQIEADHAARDRGEQLNGLIAGAPAPAAAAAEGGEEAAAAAAAAAPAPAQQQEEEAPATTQDQGGEGAEEAGEEAEGAEAGEEAAAAAAEGTEKEDEEEEEEEEPIEESKSESDSESEVLEESAGDVDDTGADEGDEEMEEAEEEEEEEAPRKRSTRGTGTQMTSPKGPPNASPKKAALKKPARTGRRRKSQRLTKK